MTDFLSRLADRVLGEAPVAKPLIAPHFAQGAEIFGPDAASFAVTQTDSYRYGDEQASDAISPGALLDTTSRFVEETESPGLKREAPEPGQQPPRKQQPAKARSTPTPHSDIKAISPPVISPVTEQKPQQPSEMEARDLPASIEPLQSEKDVQREIPQREVSKLVQKPGDVSPANEMREEMPLSEREPSSVRNTRDSVRLKARSNEQQKSPAPDRDSYSDTEEKLTSSPLSDRATENLPASLTRREGEPILPTRAISPVTKQKPQQPSEMEARNLSAGIEPLQSEKDVQREIAQQEASKLIKKPVEAKPADEMRKDRPLSEREQAPVRSKKESTRLKARSNEQQKSLAHRPEVAARQIERPSSGHPSDARVTKQRTSNQYGANQAVKSAEGEKPLARPAGSLSVESVVPVPAVPVEYDSGRSKIVRPEKITPRGRTDSPLRATTSTARPNIQTAPNIQPAPTIKVTIGRIEVRAVLPPAPRAQETALPAPRMSLDDYLKSVSGERR